MKYLTLFSLSILPLIFASCGSGGGSKSGGDAIVPATTCGTIADGKYVNPVSDSDGQVASLNSVAKNNVIILQNQVGGRLLVRLIGLTAEPQSRLAIARNFTETFSSGGLLYVPAGCRDANESGAFIGSVFNRNGENLSEALVRQGLATANPNDSCGGARIGQCFASIQNSNPINVGELSRFLWKPTSDSDTALAVHTGPFGTTVVVNGETGVNQGSGNGYGSLARFSRSGCAYGSPRIQVLNGDGIPYTVGGKTVFSVPNPCGRYCVEDGNGQVVSCSKS